MIDRFIDISTFLLSAIGIILEIKQIKLFWILYIIASILFIYEFTMIHLFASSALQIIYIILSIYGWIKWSEKSKNSNTIKIRYATNKERVIYIILTIIISIVFNFIFAKFEANSSLLDSSIAAVCIIATYMSTLKQIESFLIFALTVCFSVPLYLKNNLYFTAASFLIFGILDLIGFIQWRSIYKISNKS